MEACAAHVQQDGKAWLGELGVHDDAMLPGLRRLAEKVHQGAARCCPRSSSTAACARTAP